MLHNLYMTLVWIFDIDKNVIQIKDDKDINFFG